MLATPQRSEQNPEARAVRERFERQKERNLLTLVALYALGGMGLTYAALSLVNHVQILFPYWWDWLLIWFFFTASFFAVHLYFSSSAVRFAGNGVLLPIAAFLCATGLIVMTYLEPILFNNWVARVKALSPTGAQLYEPTTYLDKVEFEKLNTSWLAMLENNQMTYTQNQQFCDEFEWPAGSSSAFERYTGLIVQAIFPALDWPPQSDPDPEATTEIEIYRAKCPPYGYGELQWHYYLYGYFGDVFVGLAAMLAMLWYAKTTKMRAWWREPWNLRHSAFPFMLLGGAILSVFVVPDFFWLGFNNLKVAILLLCAFLTTVYETQWDILNLLGTRGFRWVLIAVGAGLLFASVLKETFGVPIPVIEFYQVSEALKLILLALFAALGSQKVLHFLESSGTKSLLSATVTLVAIFAMAALGMALMRDFGAVLIFSSILGVFVFLLMPTRRVIPLAALSLMAVVLLGYSLYHEVDHIQQRVDLWANPWKGEKVCSAEMNGLDLTYENSSDGVLTFVSTPPSQRVVESCAYTYEIAVERPPENNAGSPITITSAITLPQGLLFQDNGNGAAVLYGTPEQSALRENESAHEYTIELYAHDASGATASQTFSMEIQRAEVEYNGGQIVQYLRAILYGGIIGQGLGLGRSDLIPAASTDMVFAVVWEQYGALGGALILSLYVAFVFTGLKIAQSVEKWSYILLAAGIASLFGFQTLIIVAGTLGVIPLTGITVPFISSGFASMTLNFICVGLLLRISDMQRNALHAKPGEVSVLTRQIWEHIPHLATLLVVGFVLVFASAQVRMYSRKLPDPRPDEDQLLPISEILHQDELPFVNPWTLKELSETWRGAILHRGDMPVSEAIEQPVHCSSNAIVCSEEKGGERFYPDQDLAESLAQTIGFYSFDTRGGTGLEYSYKDYLNGRQSESSGIFKLRYRLEREVYGKDMQTTIEPDLQLELYNLLRDKTPAAAGLVMDPKTGEILAMVSIPTFNPADPENIDPTNTPFLNRPLQGLYPPGSIFKLVTAAAALEENLLTPDTVVDSSSVGICRTEHRFPGYPNMTFAEALAFSDNAVFAEVGQSLDSYRLARYAERFGFGASFDIGIPVMTSTIGLDTDYLREYPCGLAETAFGQGQIQVTPLQMALVGAAIANNGQVPYPKLLITPEIQQEGWQAISPETARQLTDMMVLMVDEPTYNIGQRARISGIRVAGKSGTAQVPNPEDPNCQDPEQWWQCTLSNHAWFIAFAPADNPQYVVVVVVEYQDPWGEGAGEGSVIAAPIVRSILEVALSSTRR